MKSITFRVEDELMEKVKIAAKQQDRSVSWLVKQLVKDGLKKQCISED